MKLNRIITVVLACVLMLKLSWVSAGMVVITHSGLSIDSLEYKKLRYIYSIQIKHWDNTKLRVVALPPESDMHRVFASKLMRVTPHVLQRQWNRLRFSGIGKGPIVVKDEQEMIVTVMNTPGAIGYVSEEFDLSNVPVNKVRILK